VPEYLYPGVYVEEVPSASRPIEGVGTSVAAFVGVAPSGPELAGPLAGIADFERLYGRVDEGPGGGAGHLGRAAWGFFRNGGRRLHIARVADPADLPAGLEALASVDEVALVAAPDAAAVADPEARLAAAEALVAHAEAKQRFALLDAPAGATAADVGALRQRLDTSYAALYAPWLVAGSRGRQAATPPSGFVAGVYARAALEHGPHVAPSGLPVGGVARVTDAPAAGADGVNVLRRSWGRGVRIWGNRTLSSDPEWKYVNVRRYLLFLERSLAQGTQWAVFETNGEALWSEVRLTAESFLLAQWRAGGMVGTRADEAFFVRCDRTTMTQNDLDNGRLVCLVGVAPLRPAEFVIFRIGCATRPDADQP